MSVRVQQLQIACKLVLAVISVVTLGKLGIKTMQNPQLYQYNQISNF